MKLTYREIYKKFKNITNESELCCEECGKMNSVKPLYGSSRLGRIHIHHIDFNHNNNDITNLKALCASCHNKAHGNRTTLEGARAAALSRLGQKRGNYNISPEVRAHMSEKAKQRGMSKCLAGYKRALKQGTIDPGRHARGNVWITDGKKNKFHKKADKIPEGWFLGMTKHSKRARIEVVEVEIEHQWKKVYISEIEKVYRGASILTACRTNKPYKNYNWRYAIGNKNKENN